MVSSARELYEAHTKWHGVAIKVGALLRHAPGSGNAPSDHALAPMARDVRNLLRQSRDIALPLPRR